MVSTARRKWAFTITLSSILRLANLQFPYPVFAIPFQPMLAVPVALPVLKPGTTTTPSTKAPEVNVLDAYKECWPRGLLPCPVLPIPFVVPAAPQPDFCKKKRQKLQGSKCPPCPPCTCNPCSPAFFSFCSPCHQACRCKTAEDAPKPLPRSPLSNQGAYPAPMPYPMAFVVAG